MNSKNFSKSSHFKAAKGLHDADALAADILVYLANDASELASFLDESGFVPSDLRNASSQPGFTLSMLDYLCSHESLLLAFAAARGLDPQSIDATRQRLASPPPDA